MPFAGEWCKVWIYFGFVFAWTKGARPRFDTSTDMGLVLIPADAEVDSVIFRLRATDQDADFPLVFEITATITPVVRIDNLPCTLYNKVCQANVILTKRLVPGRLHDFAVRVRDTKGDSNSMQATISVTNATTPRDKIFPHIPSLIMVPEDTKPGKELDYLLVRANPWSGKPVYIELWQPKELFTIRQRQTPTQTRGVVTLIGELDFETQSMYTLTMYATDPYTEPGKDTRNIAGLSVVVIVQDVQDVPPIFTLAPPLTRINNSVQPGDTIVRVHAEDGDKGVPREIVYGLVSEGNPFTPFFNISETSGEITLARPLEELTQITHVGAPVVLTVVAEELRRSREEPPAQATVVDVGFLLGEPGNSPPYFESDNYVATIDENLEPGTVINFGEQYSTRVKDEDIGKAGVFALKLGKNNGTFEITPTVAERTADFAISVRDNTLIDYELHKVLSFKIVAQEVGPATNLSASVPVTIFLKDVNDNPPVFEENSYEVTLSENVTAGSRVTQVHATDKDTGIYSSIRYTSITGNGSEAFSMDPDTGLITVSMGTSLDRETAARLVLSVEARDENGNGNRGVVPLIVNLLDVNDNAPVFEKDTYEFMLNADLTNFTSPAFIKAIDADAEPPNNVVKYELIHGNYENKFYLNETSGELILRSPITKIRRKKQSAYGKSSKIAGKEFVRSQDKISISNFKGSTDIDRDESLNKIHNRINSTRETNLSREITREMIKRRRKRAEDDALYILTARAYDLGVPHLSSVTNIRIISGIAMEARIMMFVVPGEHPDSTKTAETLAAITGGRVTVLETRPYIPQNHTGSAGTLPGGGKKSIIVARVEQMEPGTSLVDVEKIREALAANGVGIIGGTDTIMNVTTHENNTKIPVDGIPHSNVNGGQTTIINKTFTSTHSEEVTVYKAENKLLLWLLIILGILMLLAIAALIICCICPGCPFYMAPRKRRVHSSETLVVRADGRPKRHLHRQPAVPIEVSWNGRKQAWSADPTRRNWQFNKRNVKNCSLPGDVAYISGQPSDIHARLNVDVQRLREPSYAHSRRSRMDEEERMYMEDIEGQKVRGYGTAEMDSLQQHEMERGSDLQRQAYRQRSGPRYMEPDMHEETTVREQHFYREGNAEVLRLVTRGQAEDTTTTHVHHPHHHPHSTTLIVDGKDIILQRFIEDQNSRHELPLQDIEPPRSMESHQRPKEVFQQQQPEIILIPDRLELGHRQHIEEIGPNVQRLVIDHGDYQSQKMEKESQMRETLRQEKPEVIAAGTSVPMATKDHVQTSNTQYSFHDLELARQNALLTRLLLERENRRAGGAAGVDSTSYLETQSLPGQVAIATQTDRTAATQTERQVRSRSDNDESDEEARHRKKLKSRKKHGDGDGKRPRTLWMKSPIEEEGSPCFDKRLSILRKKVKEVKEGRKISLEPDVLREISDSLDGNGSSYKGEDDETRHRYRKSTEKTSISYKVLNEKENGSLSSEEVSREKLQKGSEDATDDQKMNATESTSSAEIKVQREKRGRERVLEKSPKKEAKSKIQKKSDGLMKPSFKILEKEITMLTKKLSKLGDKKFHESTGSDSTSQEKSETLSKEVKKDLDHKTSKKVDTSSSQKQVAESTGKPESKSESKMKQKKDSVVAKTKQKLKYQQTQVMSTGSSEYEDPLDKPKKSGASLQETVKQKQTVTSQGHLKLKRATQADRREMKKQMTEFRDEDIEKRKDALARDVSKAKLKPEKIEKGKMMSRVARLTAVSRKNVSEETSTSTEERKDEKSTSSLGDLGKKSSIDLSERESSGFQYHRAAETLARNVIQRFSDDFVVESKSDSAEEKAMTSAEKKQFAKEKTAVRQEFRAAGSIPLMIAGLEKLEGFPEQSGKEVIEKDTSVKKLSEDSATHLDSQGELKIIPSREKRLTESTEIIRDHATDNIIPPEAELKKIEEVKGHEKTGTKLKDAETATRNGKGKIENGRQDDKNADETGSGSIETVHENLVDYSEKDKPADVSKQKSKSKSENGLQEEEKKVEKFDDLPTNMKQEVEKVSQTIQKKGEQAEDLHKTVVEHVIGHTSTEEEKESVPKKIDTVEKMNFDIEDKTYAKGEEKHESELNILVEEKRNGNMNMVQKVEEPAEEYLKSEIVDNAQKGMDEFNIDENGDKIDQTEVKKEKQKEQLDIPHVNCIAKEEKGDAAKDTIDNNEKRITDLDKTKVPRQEGTVLEVKIADRKDEENVLLDDQKVHDKFKDESGESKTDDRVIESIVTDKNDKINDKEEAYKGKTTEDQKIIADVTERRKTAEETLSLGVVEEVIKSFKIIEPIEDHKTIGGSIRDAKGTNQPTMADKIVEELTKDNEIIKQTEVCKVVGEPIEKHKIVGEKDIVHKIDEKPTESYKPIVEIIQDHQIIGDPIQDPTIVGEPIAIHKIVDQITDDHKIADKITDPKIGEKVTKDSEIDEKITNDFQIDEKVTKNSEIDEKVTKDSEIDEKIANDFQIDDRVTKDSGIDEKITNDFQIDDKVTKDSETDKRLKEGSSIAKEPTGDSKIPEKITDDSKMTENVTEDIKLVEGRTEDFKTAEKVILDPKIIEKGAEDSKSSVKAAAESNVAKKVPTNLDYGAKTPSKKQEILKEETKPSTDADVKEDSSKEVTSPTESKSVDQQSINDRKISSDNAEIVNLPTDSQRKEKSPSLEDKEKINVGTEKASDKKDIIAEQITTDQLKFENRATANDITPSVKISDVHSDENIQSATIIKTDDEQVSKIMQDDITESKEKEVTIEPEKVDIDRITEIEHTTERPESGHREITKKEIFTETLKIDDDYANKTDIPREILKTNKEESSTSGKDIDSIIKGQSSYEEDIPLDMPIIAEDKIIEKQNGSAHVPITEKQENQEKPVITEIPISSSDSTEKETIETISDAKDRKEGNVFSEIFTAIDSLVSKVASGKGSATTSSETEIDKTKDEDQSSDDKVHEKEMSSSISEDNTKKQITLADSNETITSQMDHDELLKLTDQETVTQKEIEEHEGKDKVTYFTNEELTGDPKDINKENSSPIITADQKEKEEIPETDKISKTSTDTSQLEESIGEKETSKPLSDESIPSMKIAQESSKDGKDVTEETLEKTMNVDTKSKEIPDNETIDGKLVRTTEEPEQLHESPNKKSTSFQRTELPETSPQTSKSIEKEKLPLDSIISEAPGDTAKILEAEKQLMPGSEQTELQEVEQFVGEQTFIPEGDKTQLPSVEELHAENDESVTVSTENRGKENLTKEKTDEVVPLKQDESKEGEEEKSVEEQYADVSLPLFSSVIDTVDDSYDSDSSSDVSRKTTLTTRPYQTPRHHAREFREKEDVQATEPSEASNIDDEEGEMLTLELFDDKDIEATRVVHASPMKLAQKVNIEGVPSSEQDSMNIPIPLIPEKSVTVTDMENIGNDKENHRKHASKTDKKSLTTAAHSHGTQLETESKSQDKATGKNTSQASTTKIPKTETFRVLDRKMKGLEKKRVSSQRKKKSTSEESSEDKPAVSQDTVSYTRYRTRKKISEDQKDSDRAKQSKKTDEELSRKQSTSKLKLEKDKKSSSGSEKHQTPPKTGEIDTSKTQPKYMAWYKKNREEMERKRAELMATDDEEQLPRWLRRSMRSQKIEKEDKKAPSQKPAEGTPRMRRKVKPLVNVESEQLKAIVRQGRKLRRAEGGQNEDPPVQIFATTPPAVSQTDSKHHLVQHSEYKYEKIPPPFYLHPPPPPHPSPQLSPEHFDVHAMEHECVSEEFEAGIGVSLQGGNRLRHQQLLEKKSVFDIAYNEAAPSQLRSDSTTPPS